MCFTEGYVSVKAVEEAALNVTNLYSTDQMVQIPHSQITDLYTTWVGLALCECIYDYCCLILSHVL